MDEILKLCIKKFRQYNLREHSNYFFSQNQVHGRYSENMETVLDRNGFTLVASWGEDSYDGYVWVVARKAGEVPSEEAKYFIYDWNYGSCPGCDDWEYRQLSGGQIEAEMWKDGVVVSEEVAIKMLGGQ